MLITIENNPNKKAKENKIKMLAKAMKVHELLRKKLIWNQLEKNCNVAFQNTSNFGLDFDDVIQPIAYQWDAQFGHL